MKRLSILLVLALVLAALATNLSCGGKKSTQPKSTTSSTVPVSDGTWRVTTTLTATAGGSACSGLNSNSTDTTIIVGGLDDWFGDDCPYTITGSKFSHSCTDTLFVATGCVVEFTLMGSGTFTANSFSGTFTLTLKNTPPGCSGTIPDCTFSATVSATRIGGLPAPRAGVSRRAGWARQLLQR